MTASPSPRSPRRAGSAHSADAPAADQVNGAKRARRSTRVTRHADGRQTAEARPEANGRPATPAVAAATRSNAAASAVDALPHDRYLNRELSWLDFNARVLALAEDPRTPLLERAKFLAIFASNLDEFYMVRVAGLKRRQQTGLAIRGMDGLFPREQLQRIAERAAALVARHARCFAQDVQPALADANIKVVHWPELSAPERERMRAYFREQVFPVLTPLAVDPAHPFPYISGLSLNLAVVVRDPDGGPELFARVKVPNNVPRFVAVERERAASGEGGQPASFLPVEDLIAAHLGQLFSGMQVVEHHLFRVTRNADFELDEDRDEDLLQALERELARRRFGPAVRLEVAASISDHVLDLLVRELDMDDQDVMRIPGLLDLSSLWQVYTDTDRPDLKDPPFVPATHPQFAEGEVPRSVFNRLRDGDILVHHPYHSFSTSVQRFIEQAAADPNVLAIKQTLYRTSGDSPIVDALISAAEAGKQVVVLVEVKARFDEQANIGWARMLERAGCHVVYGLVGLKTHCKTALVVRQEGSQIRRYCHIGTGNYHPKTARMYEDFGLLTADPEVGADLTDLFNVLTGYSRQTAYRRLLVAPHGVRSGIIERIEREIEHVRAGRPGLVQIKANSLVDEAIVDALYRASRAGVDVDLVIRGICTLKPGVPGLSERIRVRSIVGRFLEHSRVFRFGDGQVPPRENASGDGAALEPSVPGGEFWIGSADLMHRNLDRRVEALVRVVDPAAKVELDRVMRLIFTEKTTAFELAADGTWQRCVIDGDESLINPQQALLRRIVNKVD
ncbi:RNA degradosome polyphosphate kinase [Planosporangium flavigriseum]|uniref:Polyphosphate kinase n=1 Tax=Planosporangium flavigriseum TaxID=373681 RepID=A0A8J3PK71_9ACTN|nr:RNA degradosome polyphosphate kinase [Planosporangium flavigriseum]NJC64169.1 RNA degradosome polyphosphate kinase [Planosporangium flavigriseum]GIG73051.1 polyphosphate kinase [Planosporangium flavigriseum]